MAPIAPAQTPETGTPKSSKLEELLIWKLSDELRLTTAEEKKFSEAVRDLSARKTTLGQRLEKELDLLKNAKTPADRKKRLKTYRTTLQELQKLPVDEIDHLEAILGTERLAKYLDVKADLVGKVKALLIEKAEHKDGGQALPPPKIREEGSGPAR